MKILVLNSGSSSQKSSLYEIGETLPTLPPVPLWDAKLEWDNNSADLQIKKSGAAVFSGRMAIESRRQAIDQLLRSLWEHKSGAIARPSDIDIVGHRIVHGGPRFEEPTVVSTEVKQAIASASAFAPLHNRAELEGIEIVGELLVAARQVAVFDTGFHHRLPLAAAVYPGPYEWFERGIRRYGFHGISHRYCAQRAAQLLGRNLTSLKLITCHLGNGCSLAAIDCGRSVDTTMGFSPLEGLMMGTRSGSVDPSILTYLMRQQNMNSQELDEQLNRKSGLLGISGVSSDMRQILAAVKEGNERAKLAFDIFIHRLRSGIGAMVAVLGGLDALIFTAGIGENSAEVRSAACDRLKFMGLNIDSTKNSESPADQDVATHDSCVRVLVVRTQEDWAIARECWTSFAGNHRGLPRLP